jgi:hypothetical protein
VRQFGFVYSLSESLYTPPRYWIHINVCPEPTPWPVAFYSQRRTNGRRDRERELQCVFHRGGVCFDPMKQVIKLHAARAHMLLDRCQCQKKSVWLIKTQPSNQQKCVEFIRIFRYPICVCTDQPLNRLERLISALHVQTTSYGWFQRVQNMSKLKTIILFKTYIIQKVIWTLKLYKKGQKSKQRAYMRGIDL